MTMSSGRRVSQMALEVIIRWLPFKGGEGVMGLFEEASDRVGCHNDLLCFRCRAGAVKDCDDSNEGNCVGKGNLRLIGTF